MLVEQFEVVDDVACVHIHSSAATPAPYNAGTPYGEVGRFARLSATAGESDASPNTGGPGGNRTHDRAIMSRLL